MGETDKSYWLLSETSGIGETRDPRLYRGLPLLEGLRWLSAGWRDFWTQPASSVSYGVGVFLLSVAFVWTLLAFGRGLYSVPGARWLHDRGAFLGYRVVREEPRAGGRAHYRPWRYADGTA